MAAVGQPTVTAIFPAPNAKAAARSSAVSVTFSQPLLGSSAAALKIYSAQRGGLRSRGATPALVNGNTLTFAPSAYPFLPGETVFSTVTTAAASSSGNLVKGKVVQFTVAATGLGRGTFVPGLAPAVGVLPIGAALADVDGDGDLDLLTNTSGSVVNIRLNGGNASGSNTGRFSNGSDVTVGNNTANASQKVMAADVDGDGDLDLLTPNYDDNTVSVRLNGGNATGSNTGVFSLGSVVGVGVQPLCVVLGDVDGDGDLDLLTANSYSQSVSVRLNGGDATGSNPGTFSSGSDIVLGPFGLSPYGLTVGDVDGDGDLDFVVTTNASTNPNTLSNTASVFLNGGDATGSNTGAFSSGSDVAVGVGRVVTPIGVVLADVDGDSDLDLLTANYDDGTASVRLNGGNATGSNTGTFSNGSDVAVGRYPCLLVLADFDGDGDLDLLVPNSYDATVSLRLNGGNATGSNTGVFSNGYDILVGNYPYSIAVGDVDGDGDIDFVTPNFGSNGTNNGRVSVRLNGGTQLAVRTPRIPSADAFAVFPTVVDGGELHYNCNGIALLSKATLAIYSVTGQRVWEQTTAVTETGTLPVAGMASGWYAVKLQTATGCYVSRFFHP